MAQQLEEFEKRAKMAEDQIAELTKRLGVLERRGESAPSNNANASKLQLLDELRDLRFSLGKDKAKSDEIADKCKKLEAENITLKTENEKLKYRIKHLLRSLEDEEAKNAGAK